MSKQQKVFNINPYVTRLRDFRTGHILEIDSEEFSRVSLHRYLGTNWQHVRIMSAGNRLRTSPNKAKHKVLQAKSFDKH